MVGEPGPPSVGPWDRLPARAMGSGSILWHGMNEDIKDQTPALPTPGIGSTSTAERSAETMSDFAEHVWEVEHVGRAALDAPVDF